VDLLAAPTVVEAGETGRRGGGEDGQPKVRKELSFVHRLESLNGLDF
jgi:hypothetical protein